MRRLIGPFQVLNTYTHVGRILRSISSLDDARCLREMLGDLQNRSIDVDCDELEGGKLLRIRCCRHHLFISVRDEDFAEVEDLLRRPIF